MGVCNEYFKDIHDQYRRRLSRLDLAMAQALKPASSKETYLNEVTLPLVLSSSDDENIDSIHSYMNMTFNLGKWIDDTVTSPERAEMLRFPQLAIATLTPFQYVDISGASNVDFIKAHLGDQQQVVDETMLNQKYSQENGSWGDMPHGGKLYLV